MNFYKTDRLQVFKNENPCRISCQPYCLNEDGTKNQFGVSSYAKWNWWWGLNGITDHGSHIVADLNPALVHAIHKWPEDQIDWQSDSLKERVENVLVEQQNQNRYADLQLRFKNKEEYQIDFNYDTRKPLKDYQKLAAYIACNQESYALLKEQGTGKTPTSIAITEFLSLQEPESLTKVLIVCPAPLKFNWKQEFKEFATLNYHTHIVQGQQTDRVIATMEAYAYATSNKKDYFVCICPFDTLTNSEALFTKYIKWDICIVDESHYFKDPKTRRWKTLKNIRDVCKRRYILTGTPVGNSVMDLYTQLEFLGAGVSGCSSEKQFRRQHCVTKDVAPGIESIVSSKVTDELKEILARKAFIVQKKDVLDLPDKVHEYRDVEMTPQQKKNYDQLATMLYAQLEGMEDSVTSVEHMLTQLLRLAQVTSGILVTDEVWEAGTLIQPKKIHYYDPNNRLQCLVDLANELPPNEKMLIWNVWIPMIDPIINALTDQGHKVVKFRGTPQQKEEAKDAYNNDPSTRFLIANAASAGVGNTFIGYDKNRPEEYNTDTTQEVFFSYNWSYLQREQAMARAHRIGTRKQIKTIDIVVPNSIDMEIMERLQKKGETSSRLMDIKEILERIMNV